MRILPCGGRDQVGKQEGGDRCEGGEGEIEKGWGLREDVGEREKREGRTARWKGRRAKEGEEVSVLSLCPRCLSLCVACLSGLCVVYQFVFLSVCPSFPQVVA